jgi:hypothetical protein
MPGVSDFYEPWDRLIRLVILGKVFQVPENNTLLRQLQYLSEDVGMGRYCWNGECRYCEVHFERPGDPLEYPALACRVRGFDGMRITKLAPEVRYNLSDALAAAPREDEEASEPPAGPSPPSGE